MADTQTAAGPLILAIPFALWVAVGVAVLSGVVTLIGVWRSNRNSRRNLEKQLAASSTQLATQLAHDADQRDRERTMSLRREVYLEVAGALSRGTQVLGRITDTNYEMQALSAEFADALAKLAKVQMVGSDKTVEAVMTYVNELGPAFLALLVHRTQLVIRKQAIEGEGDPAKKAQLLREQVKVSLEAAEQTIALAIKTTRLLPNAVLAVREEMELPLDRERYRALWEEQFRRMNEVWSEVRSQLEGLSG